MKISILHVKVSLCTLLTELQIMHMQEAFFLSTFNFKQDGSFSIACNSCTMEILQLWHIQVSSVMLRGGPRPILERLDSLTQLSLV